MKGIFLKEIYMLRVQWKSWLFLVGFMSFIGLCMGSVSYLYSVIVMVGLLSAMSAFSMDQASRWEDYALSLPVTREQLVQCRYTVCLAGMGGIAAVSAVLSLGINAVSKEMKAAELLAGFFTNLIVGIVFLAALLPIVYKVGVEKARYVYMALIAGTGFLVYATIQGYARIRQRASSPVDWDGMMASLSEMNGWVLAGIIAAAAAGVLFVSYKISCRIYKAKDF